MYCFPIGRVKWRAHAIYPFHRKTKHPNTPFEQKQGVKYMSGAILKKRLETLEEIERVRELQRERLMLEQRQETETVLAQPHRRGDDGDMVDPLGRFVMACGFGREAWEAGWSYFRLVYRWQVASGIPVALRLAEGESCNGGELEPETVQDWLAKIKACEFELKRSGLSVFNAAQRLLLDGVYPEDRHAQGVKRGLRDLAVELGKLSF